MAEERDTYTTDASVTSQDASDNVRRFPMRGFTQADNAYYDELLGVVSPTAYYCLMYIVRNTIGYHRDSIRLSFKQLGDALNLSRNTVMKGLQELETAHIIGSDASERGRTQVRAYRLLPIANWTLQQRTVETTSAKNELEEQEETSVKTGLVTSIASAKNELVVSKNALVGGQTSAKNEHPINKERNKLSKERSDANASHTPATPDVDTPTQTRKSTRTRKLTEEQYAAHQAEAAYIAQALTAYRAELRVSKLPSEGQQRDGARWFYAARDGQSVPPDELMEWYRLTKSLPFWHGKFLSLKSLEKPFTAHGGDLAAYRDTVAQETQQRRGGSNNGTARREQQPPQQPDPNRHGKYARFVH